MFMKQLNFWKGWKVRRGECNAVKDLFQPFIKVAKAMIEDIDNKCYNNLMVERHKMSNL